MSASLIRRGLELLNDDIKGVPENKQLKTKKNHAVGKPGVMDQISSNRQGVTKQIRRLQGQRGSSKNKATVKDKRIKYAVDEFRKKQKSSQMSQNLSYFTGQGFKAEQSDTHKILLHNKGRQSWNRPDRPVRKQEERSVFTEEEFQQFQREYFGGSVEDGSK